MTMGDSEQPSDEDRPEVVDTTPPTSGTPQTPTPTRPRYRLAPDIPWLEAETLISPRSGYVIDAAILREDTNKITFPARVRNAELVLPDDLLYWGYETELDLVVATPYRRDVEFCERFEYVQHSSVSSQGVTNVPKQFFDDYEGPYDNTELAEALKVPDEYRLEYGQPYFIYTSPLLLLRTKLCYLVSVPRSIAFVGEDQTRAFAKELDVLDAVEAVIDND